MNICFFILLFLPLLSLASPEDNEVEYNITMNNSTSSAVGNIMKKGSRFIHNTGKANTFVGFDAGSFSVTGMGNVGFGTDSLLNISTGMGNSGIGFSSLVNNRIGDGNTATGVMTLEENTNGDNNTAIGCYALCSNTTGSGNIALGANAGLLLVDGENNMYLGNNGVPSENGTIRIGTEGIHNTTIMQGIFGSITGMENLPVVIDSTGKLGTVVLPELVVFDEQDQPHTIHYQELPILLLQEIHKQYAMIQALTKRIEQLEARA